MTCWLDWIPPPASKLGSRMFLWSPLVKISTRSMAGLGVGRAGRCPPRTRRAGTRQRHMPPERSTANRCRMQRTGVLVRNPHALPTLCRRGAKAVPIACLRSENAPPRRTLWPPAPQPCAPGIFRCGCSTGLWPYASGRRGGPQATGASPICTCSSARSPVGSSCSAWPGPWPEHAMPGLRHSGSPGRRCGPTPATWSAGGHHASWATTLWRPGPFSVFLACWLCCR